MGRIVYLLILKPLSWFPLEMLYYLSNFIYFLVYHVVGYRKKVVLENLHNSFPEKNEDEINKICNHFYQHLTDLIVESIKLFSNRFYESIWHTLDLIMNLTPLYSKP